MTNLSAASRDSTPHSDTSNLPTTDIFGGRNPRLVTEPWREIASLALLGANAVFLFLGITGLFFVLDGWASGFGIRSAAAYGVFVAGLIPVGFPILAVLLATHVRPIVGRARLITLVAVIQYGVSAVLGLITFLGAFASDLDSVRATLEGVLYRLTWAGLVAFTGMVTVRLWLGLFYVPKPRAVPQVQYSPSYGQPYPGQPMYPSPAYQPGRAEPPYSGGPATQAGTPVTPRLAGTPGWPAVPPPPMPEPVPESDLTQRLPTTAPREDSGMVETSGPDATATADGNPAGPTTFVRRLDGAVTPSPNGSVPTSPDGAEPAGGSGEATQRIVPPEPPTRAIE